MIKITYEDLLELHDYALEEGGLSGVNSESALRSALENPFTTFFGEELYKTDEEKIAMTIYSLINNHGFKDANKRTAILVFHVLLDACDIELFASEDDYIQLAINVTQTYDKYDIQKWINDYKK